MPNGSNEGINFPVQLTIIGTLTMQMRMKSLSRLVKMFLLLRGMVERKARRAPPRMKTSKEEMVARAQEKTIPAVIRAGNMSFELNAGTQERAVSSHSLI